MEVSFVKGKNLINEKLSQIASFKELTFFFLKYSFSCTKIFGALVLTIIIFIGTIAEVPYYFAFGGALNFALFLISAMIYGSIFYTFRKSTIFENMRETNLNKKEIYLAIFISMFLFTGLMYLFLISLFSLCIFIDSPLLMNDWFFNPTGNGTGGLFLSEVNAQLLFWWYFAFILLNFALFYLFQNISNTKKSFFLFVFVYLILLIIYGNTLNPPEIRMTYNGFYDANEEFIKTTLNWNWSLENYELKVLLWHFHIPGELHVQNNLSIKWQDGHYIAVIFSILVPHSWINTFCAQIWKSTALKTETINFRTHVGGSFYTLPPISFSGAFLKNAPIWKIRGQFWWALAMYLWMPYFALLYFSGTFFSRIKKINSV